MLTSKIRALGAMGDVQGAASAMQARPAPGPAPRPPAGGASCDHMDLSIPASLCAQSCRSSLCAQDMRGTEHGEYPDVVAYNSYLDAAARAEVAPHPSLQAPPCFLVTAVKGRASSLSLSLSLSLFPPLSLSLNLFAFPSRTAGARSTS